MNLFHRLGVGNSPESPRGRITFACDPETFHRTLTHKVPVRKMKPGASASTNLRNNTGVTRVTGQEGNRLEHGAE